MGLKDHLLSGLALGAAMWPLAGHTEPATPAATAPIFAPELTSGITFTEEHSDNIFATRTHKLPDWISVVAPFANLRFRGSNGHLNVGASAAIGRYATYTSEDYNDYRVYGDGRYNISPSLTLFGGSSYERRHEDRSSPDARAGVTPTIYYVTRAFGAALKTFGWGSIRVGSTVDQFNYNNVPATGGGVIINDDRDRNMVTAGTRIGYNLNKTDEIFGMLTYDLRDYRLPVDDYGYMKDSAGARVSAGWRRRVGSNLEVEGYVGAIFQDYRDPRFSTVWSPDFGGRVIWSGIPGTTVTTIVERTLQETDLAGASGYLQTSGSFDVVHWIRPDLRVNGSATYAYNQYNEIDRVDQVASVGLGVRKYVTPHLFFGADLSHTSRDSSSIASSYNESRVMFRAGAVQAAVYKPDDFKKPEVPQEIRRTFYVGFQTGPTVVGTKLQGSRGNAGSLQADFAGDGWVGSILAGYGVYLGDWFLGLEADIGKGSGGWNHANVPNERVFSVSQQLSYGLSVLAGRTFQGGTMLYGKAGVTASRFDTDYELHSDSAHQRQTQGGLRIGMGGSVPITRQLSLRLEHTFAAFESYSINCCVEPPRPDAERDNFTNDETRTTVGLIYQFGADSKSVVPVSKTNFGGFYGGLQVGHEALWTRTTGPRESGRTLTADFGDTGFTGGIFAGYGRQLANIYIGGELEAELAKTTWDHLREPSGRTYSLENDGTFGASVRAGYVVNDTALLYARFGAVQSQLNVDYQRGNNNVSARDFVTGVRFGAGMEFPASESVFLRLDYTHTNYSRTSLITPPDQEMESYKSQTDLFRFGVLRRFQPH